VTGSEATAKHKITLDPICTPPTREASLHLWMVRHAVLDRGADAGGWVVCRRCVGIVGAMLGGESLP